MGAADPLLRGGFVALKARRALAGNTAGLQTIETTTRELQLTDATP